MFFFKIADHSCFDSVERSRCPSLPIDMYVGFASLPPETDTNVPVIALGENMAANTIKNNTEPKNITASNTYGLLSGKGRSRFIGLRKLNIIRRTAAAAGLAFVKVIVIKKIFEKILQV